MHVSQPSNLTVYLIQQRFFVDTGEGCPQPTPCPPEPAPAPCDPAGGRGFDAGPPSASGGPPDRLELSGATFWPDPPAVEAPAPGASGAAEPGPHPGAAMPPGSVGTLLDVLA